MEAGKHSTGGGHFSGNHIPRLTDTHTAELLGFEDVYANSSSGVSNHDTVGSSVLPA